VSENPDKYVKINLKEWERMDKEIMEFLLEFREEVNQRFEQVDKRFERLENRSDQHEGMIQQLIDVVGSTNKKVDSLSERVDQMQKQIDLIAAQQTDIEHAHQRITRNERNIAKIKAVLLGEIN